LTCSGRVEKDDGRSSLLAKALWNMDGLKARKLMEVDSMIPLEKEKFLEVLFNRTRGYLEELSFIGVGTWFFDDRYYPAGVSPRFPMLKRIEWEFTQLFSLGEFFILTSLT
jgi:hypothetical protein